MKNMKRKSLLSVCTLLVLMLLSVENLKAQWVVNWWQETPPAGKHALHRLRRNSTGKHILANIPEAYSLSTIGWTYEGKLGYLATNWDTSFGAVVPLYRYYKDSQTDHYYSLSSTAPSGYVLEGIMGYVPTTGGTFSDGVTYSGAIYGYHRNSGSPDHFYTNTFSELGGGNSTWYYDGIVFYLFKL